MAALKQSESQQAGFVTEADRTAYEQHASAAAQGSLGREMLPGKQGLTP